MDEVAETARALGKLYQVNIQVAVSLLRSWPQTRGVEGRECCGREQVMEGGVTEGGKGDM